MKEIFWFFTRSQEFFQEKSGKLSSRRLFALAFDAVFLVIWAYLCKARAEFVQFTPGTIITLFLVNGLASVKDILMLFEKAQELKQTKLKKGE